MNGLLPPPQLMQQFEDGLLSREQLHEAMAEHGKILIAEMEYEHQHRQESWIERWRCKHHAARLVNRHGEALVREVLAALAELPDFPPCQLLWNAAHTHVPLFCFFRLKRPPLFFIRMMRWQNARVELQLEYSLENGQCQREHILLERGRRWNLQILSRKPIS